uniref:Uncharacterized protein n=1 Tax=Branchiostoma floridae TaxID=7739 RepID=C3Z5Q0_BRAFL|eukprot:XP_002596151.1 hypothetical protein BRAFLDRAFT_66119 [Branchiostoma floridae]
MAHLGKERSRCQPYGDDRPGIVGRGEGAKLYHWGWLRIEADWRRRRACWVLWLLRGGSQSTIAETTGEREPAVTIGLLQHRAAYSRSGLCFVSWHAEMSSLLWRQHVLAAVPDLAASQPPRCPLHPPFRAAETY